MRNVIQSPKRCEECGAGVTVLYTDPPIYQQPHAPGCRIGQDRAFLAWARKAQSSEPVAVDFGNGFVAKVVTVHPDDAGTEVVRFTLPARCWCITCGGDRVLGTESIFPMRIMVLCPTCGNKRCPKATFHGNDCTGSNEPGQKGSIY